MYVYLQGPNCSAGTSRGLRGVYGREQWTEPATLELGTVQGRVGKGGVRRGSGDFRRGVLNVSTVVVRRQRGGGVHGSGEMRSGLGVDGGDSGVLGGWTDGVTPLGG